MVWVKIDDRFFDNPKIAVLSPAAKVAHLEAICYCSRELTDGKVPGPKAKAIAASRRVLQELVPQLWEPDGTNYRVHDFLQYNPSRADVLKAKSELSQKRSEAGKKGMAKRWQTDNTSDNKQDNNEHNPVPRIPEGDLNNPLPNPEPGTPLPRPPLPNRVVVVGFEQCFGRLLSPTELELVRALEDEHPKERIDYALREAAALNKRSVRYVQRTCERIANDGESNGTDRGKSAASANPAGVATGLSDMDKRRAFVAAGGRDG